MRPGGPSRAKVIAIVVAEVGAVGLLLRKRDLITGGLNRQGLPIETIQHLHTTLLALPRPLLESLTRAFRKQFQVPDEAVTIADRIYQKRHHDWIEAFLVSHREVRLADQHREVRLADQHREVRSVE